MGYRWDIELEARRAYQIVVIPEGEGSGGGSAKLHQKKRVEVGESYIYLLERIDTGMRAWGNRVLRDSYNNTSD